MTIQALQAKLAEAERQHQEARARLGDATLAHEQGDESAGKRKAQAAKDVQVSAQRRDELHEAVRVQAEQAKQREAANKSAADLAACEALAADLEAFKGEAAVWDDAVRDVLRPIANNAQVLAQRIVATSGAVMKSMGRPEDEINSQVQSALRAMFATLAYQLRHVPGVRCPVPFIDESRARVVNYCPTMPAPRGPKG